MIVSGNKSNNFGYTQNQEFLIRFKKDWRVEWCNYPPELAGHNSVTLTFKKGDVVSCHISPDGPGSEEYEEELGRCAELFLPGEIDLWNVPFSHFEILLGPEIPEQEDS